jgi:hypothetical protein
MKFLLDECVAWPMRRLLAGLPTKTPLQQTPPALCGGLDPIRYRHYETR